MLVEKDRFWHFDRIARQYERLYEKEDGFLPRQVYRGEPLKKLQEEAVRRDIEEFLCA